MAPTANAFPIGQSSYSHPGGWRIIGRTPLKLYNPDSDTPVYISSGDYVRYVSISEEEYNDILKKVENNEYKLNIRKIKRGELNA